MKTSVVVGSLLASLTLTAVTVVQFTGLVSIPHLTTTVVVGGLTSAGVVALALRDYARKASLGNRRASASAPRTEATTPCTLENAETDWTYIVRSA